jgi:hypothetical protein
MTQLPALDVESPVQAEVFVVWLNGDRPELTGPCGAGPWIIELETAEHPMETVARIVRDVIGQATLVHSTSWRRDREAVILSFVAVIGPEARGRMESAPIGRSDLARSRATAAPQRIAYQQVLEHGLRHLAWLAREDVVVAAELTPAWHAALSAYVPEPFRSFG